MKAPIEVLLVRPLGPDTWETLVKPGRRIRVGERLQFGGGQLQAVVLERGERGLRVVRFEYQGDFDAIVDRLGHIPLPPYIRRPDERRDRTRYQTVYASKRGAVAAPTAGLHFTPQVLSGLSRKGVARCEVTLHVGLGTFRPVVSERIEDHRMETEPFEMTPEAARTISTAKSARQRIVAVGTTVTRVLESAFRGAGAPTSRGNRSVHLSRLPLSPGRSLADKLSPAGLHASHAGVRLRRTRSRVRGLSGSPEQGLPLLQLRRLHADRVKCGLGPFQRFT